MKELRKALLLRNMRKIFYPMLDFICDILFSPIWIISKISQKIKTPNFILKIKKEHSMNSKIKEQVDWIIKEFVWHIKECTNKDSFEYKYKISYIKDTENLFWGEMFLHDFSIYCSDEEVVNRIHKEVEERLIANDFTINKYTLTEYAELYADRIRDSKAIEKMLENNNLYGDKDEEKIIYIITKK